LRKEKLESYLMKRRLEESNSKETFNEKLNYDNIPTNILNYLSLDILNIVLNFNKLVERISEKY